MDGQRKALIVANDEYEHEGLRHLLAPAADAEALAGVLGDSQIGDFDVRVVHNEPAHDIEAQIEDIWCMEIEPYLDEYFYDRPGALKDYGWESVRVRILGDADHPA